MWDLCTNALDTARLRGAAYGDVRVMHLRQRDLTTKTARSARSPKANPSASAFVFSPTALGASPPPIA